MSHELRPSLVNPHEQGVTRAKTNLEMKQKSLIQRNLPLYGGYPSMGHAASSKGGVLISGVAIHEGGVGRQPFMRTLHLMPFHAHNLVMLIL